MMLEPSTIRLHGRDLNYIIAGEGPPLLLVHGVAGDWRTWEPVISGLACDHEVIAVDLPGHGASQAGAGDYSLGGLANVLRDLIGAWATTR